MRIPQLKWAHLPVGAALGIIIAVCAVVAALPQAFTILLLAPHVFRGGDRLSLWQVFGLWGHSDPSEVTGAAAPGWVHHVLAWLLLAFIAAAVVAVMVVRHRRSKDPQRKPGLASIQEVTQALGEKQLVRTYGPKLRPSLPPAEITPESVGFLVGSFMKIPLWLRVEDPIIVIGPSRAGKGWYLVLNWILGAPGAVVTTSSKLDNAVMTMRLRERMGSRVWVFAPGTPSGEALDHVLRWDPVAGCVDEETLVRRIQALIPQDSFSGNTSNGGHWDTLGQQLASHLFHAAACLGADVDRIWEWVSSPQRAYEAVQAIREHPDGLTEHAAHLETVLNLPPDQRATQWGVLPTVLAFMSTGVARKWMKPGPGEEIDLVDFVLNRGTLYLVGDKNASGGYKRIIDGLLAEIDYVTKGLADASPRARLDPPVTYILDECGNFEYQGLYELITAGGGRGRVVVAVFQSREQLDQWGASDANTMWDAAVAKIVLPGGGDADKLEAMAKLAGALWVQRESFSYGSGSSSTQTSEEKRSVIEASEIRELIGGYTLLFYRNLKPIVVRLNPFNKHPHYEACEADQLQLGEQMRARSPFAAAITLHLGASAEQQRAELAEAKRTYA